MIAFLGACLSIRYRYKNNEKQRKYESEEAEKQYKRELEKIILDKFLSGYNINDFAVEHLKEIKEWIFILLSSIKEKGISEDNSIEEELRRIKKENDDSELSENLILFKEKVKKSKNKYDD